MKSVHENEHEDRRWAFECAPLANGYSECSWTGYVNDWDDPMNFVCPGTGGVVSGMESEHNNHHEDRMYGVYFFLKTDMPLYIRFCLTNL